MSELFEAVREVCPRGLWSRGTKLARAGAVQLARSEQSEEIIVRVECPERAVAPTVVMYPADAEWDCDCGSKVDACAHIAAAVIALQAAEQSGEDLADVELVVGGALSYRFHRDGHQLVMARYVGNQLVTGSIRVCAGLQPSWADFEVDDLLGDGGTRPLRRTELTVVLAALDGAADVRFEGASVYTSGDPVLPIGIVRDDGDRVRLEVVANPAISEIVAAGVALCGEILQPLGHTEITGDRLEQLPFVKIVERGDYAALVTELIPSLERDIPVEIQTARLPEVTTAAQPRIELEIEQAERLSVLPTLVYGTPPIARIDGDRMVHLRGPAPIRDRAKEKQLLTHLRDELNLAPGRKVELLGTDATRFAVKLRAWRGEDARHPGHDYVMPAPLVPYVNLEDGFAVAFETDEADPEARRRVSAAAVIGAWQSGLELVPLDGGGWAPLPEDWLRRHGDRVADLLAARDEQGQLPRCALPNLAALCEDLGEPMPPTADAVTTLLAGFDGIPEATLPPDFTGTLRHYQHTGVNWLCCLRDAGLGAVLADDMGLGKTVQALCALQGRSLVVCPTSVLPTWAAEAQRFRPELRTCVFHGPSRTLDEQAELTITTYALLRIDSKRLSAVEWDMVIIDESQAIKNPQSQVARAAYKLQARSRLALSGTPVENRLDELWSQLHFTNRGLLGDRGYFQKRYARPIARAEEGAAARLRDRIRPFLLRRLKKEVAPELPPRTEGIIYCELTEPERSVYDAIRVATKQQVVSKLREGGSVMAALEALLRLRQAACHPSLVPGQQAEGSSKLTELLEALDRVVAAGHKALVFSQWTSLLDLCEPHLHGSGLEFVRLDGSTRDRGAVVEKFQSEQGPPVMLVSLKAGGTGLTLTAADHVFLLDPWWNPAVEDQAADRTHRIGQTRPVMVYRMVASDTVESRILALQEKKRTLAEAALGDSDRAGGLTRDDLLTLLA